MEKINMSDVTVISVEMAGSLSTPFSDLPPLELDELIDLKLPEDILLISTEMAGSM